jgi:predicted Holliday junction resolvase-like endonuclease
MKCNYSAKADQTAIATDINDLPINKKVIRNAIETSSKKVLEEVLENIIEKVREEVLEKVLENIIGKVREEINEERVQKSRQRSLLA